MKTVTLLPAIISILLFGKAFAQSQVGIPDALNGPGCVGVPNNDECRRCMFSCFRSSLRCAVSCAKYGYTSQECKVGCNQAEQTCKIELIVYCLPDLHWSQVLHRLYTTLFPLGHSQGNCMCQLQRPQRSEPDVCFPCEASLLRKTRLTSYCRCLGSYGTPGFCTAAGQAGFADNGGRWNSRTDIPNIQAHIPQATVAVELHLTAIPLLGHWPNVPRLPRCSHLLGEMLRSQ